MEIIGERVGQQLKHPDHMLVINAQSAGVAPSFHFVDIDTLTVTHETALQYPQMGFPSSVRRSLTLVLR
ncbi:hypothetical protein JCM19233_1790 [Vibrio astriarenae]|nr:hypothetical protein JCM19233_1790 [Vibrio sp. C7]